MDLLVNDLSVHEQFHDLTEFQNALTRLMELRAAAKRFGREVQCNGKFCDTMPLPDMPMRQAIGKLRLDNQRRAVMVWLDRSGPFWDDMRKHGQGDWLECDGSVVTDTAVGETAFRALHGVGCGLISVSPSDWNSSPVEVNWRREDEGLDDRHTKLENWWNAASLEEALQDRAPPVRSWDELRRESVQRFGNLTFDDDCFEPLTGVPFTRGAAERFLVLLEILERFSQAFDVRGARTAEGHRIYQDSFTGDRALFSDSSDSEKRNFRQELSFPNSRIPKASLPCTWHGKVSHPTLPLRLHFSWPFKAGKPVYVVYAGPKITRR